MCEVWVSLTPDIFLVAIVAVEWAHAPIILEKSAAVPILVYLMEQKFTLNV